MLQLLQLLHLNFVLFSITVVTRNCTIAVQTTIWTGCGVLTIESFGFLITCNLRRGGIFFSASKTNPFTSICLTSSNGTSLVSSALVKQDRMKEFT